MTTEAERIAETAAMLRAAAGELGMVISADQRIREADAEMLCGYSAGSFRVMRDLGSGPPHYRAAVAGSRYSYRIPHLAAWLESRREDPAL